jgi:hypothetical protein
VIAVHTSPVVHDERDILQLQMLHQSNHSGCM